MQRPEDLRGLAVGVSNFGATTHVALKVALEHWGLEEGRDVTVVRSGGTPETIAAMQSGAIAGGSFGAPQSFLAHDLGFRELIDVATLRFELGSAAVISTRRYVAEHPDLVERYLKALMLGVQAYRTRKDLAVDAIMRYGRIDDRLSAERTWEYFLDKFSADLAMSPRAVENNLRMMADTQPGALSASAEQFLDGSFVERIRASGYLEQIARGHRRRRRASASSRPPRRIRPAPARPENAAPGRQQRGGQPGHCGACRGLLPVEQADEVVRVVPPVCRPLEKAPVALPAPRGLLLASPPGRPYTGATVGVARHQAGRWRRARRVHRKDSWSAR